MEGSSSTWSEAGSNVILKLSKNPRIPQQSPNWKVIGKTRASQDSSTRLIKSHIKEVDFSIGPATPGCIRLPVLDIQPGCPSDCHMEETSGGSGILAAKKTSPPADDGIVGRRAQYGTRWGCVTDPIKLP
jgi:hypothetical protein